MKLNKYSCILIIPLTKMYICFRLNKYIVEIKISRVKCAQCIIIGVASPPQSEKVRLIQCDRFFVCCNG